MSTFLELSNQLRLDSGISGNGPASTINQVGMDARMVNWVNRSWMYIQHLYPNWEWMLKEFSFEAAVGMSFTPASAGITDFSRWSLECNAFTAYPVAAGITQQSYLKYLPCNEWEDKYLFGGGVDPGAPAEMSIDPKNDALLIGPEPNESYIIQGKYIQEATELSGDSDTPSMPAQFHRVIVDKALLFFAAHVSSAEIFTTATKDLEDGMSRLELNQKPMMSINAGSLA